MKKTVSIIAALCMAISLSACSQAGSTATPDTATTPSAEASTPSASPSHEQAGDATGQPTDSGEPESAHYPVTITNYNFAGEEVELTFEKAPEKVLAVYQGCIETMAALGLDGHVVASYGLDNEVKPEWQDSFAKMNYNDEVFAPDKESVIMMEPDFIFTWGSFFGEERLGDVDYWIGKGTNTYLNSNTRAGGRPRTLENEYNDILNIGKIFDVEDKAEAMVQDMKDDIASAIQAAEGQDKPKVVIIEYLTELRNYGASSLGGDMVTKLGAELAIPDASAIGHEDLVATDPDIIFVVYMPYNGDDPEQVKQDNLDKVLKEPGLANLSAVKSNKVYPIMLSNMYASGPRTADGIKAFSEFLYPNLAE